jgi:hypothetical protein
VRLALGPRAAVALGVAALAACGSDPKPAPGPDDIARIGSSIGDIVYQCQSVEAGFIAEPDREQLTRDVDALLSAFERVSPDARFTVGASPGPTRKTTARDELRLARRTLASCDPGLAERLETAGTR